MPTAPDAQPAPRPTQCDLLAQRHILVRPIRVMRRVRRRNRWLLRVVLAIPFLGVTAGVILTRSAVTRWIVLPQLEQALNMEVTADSVYIGFSGKLYIDRAHFRLPGLSGPAGDFLKVARVEVGVDWLASLAAREVELRGIRMTDPIVTISQSREDRSLNIGALDLPASSGAMGLPNIFVTNAGIELAEHSPTTYSVLKHVRMDGWLVPAKNDPDGYTFQLVEKTARVRRPEATSEPGFKLRGTLGSAGAFSVTMENFSLDDWPDSSIPFAVRDLFHEMNLQGEVPRAFLTYTQDKGIAARLELSGVGMNLPIQPTEVTTIPEAGVPVVELHGPPPQSMRMHGVSGAITFARDQVFADVQGRLENLPYHVKLQYFGTGADAPFKCEVVSNDFLVDRNPRLLLFAPPVVKERLATFSSPTAVVNTRLTITRGQPVRDEPGEIDLEGELEMRDGVAAFEGFPYEFQNISGRFRFTESSLEFLNITGRSASGAELTAHGRISPLTDDAEVNVAVDVRNAPIDAAMEASFGEGRGEMIPALFSTRRYEELRAAGLIQTPAEAEQAATRLGALVDRQNSGDASPELAAEIEDARRSAAIPAFEFRGSADVSVRVHRPLGDEVDWQTDVEIRLPKVGLLPDKFPLPIAATNILARVHDRDGALVSGDFRGLTGGRADVHATFNIPFADDLEQEVRPDITIQAAGIPLDPVLIHALPGENRGPDEGPGSESAVKRILHALNISGEGDGRVRIATGGDGELGFEADFTLRDSQALPDGSDVSLGNVFGRVRASESSVNVELAAQARRRDLDQWRAISGPMQVRIDARIPPAAAHAPATYNAELDIPSLDIASPVEPLLSIFSPAAAQKIADLRAAHNPSGEVDLEAMVIADGGDHTRVNVEARGARPVSFDAMNGRFAFTPSSGAFRLASGESTRISFDQLKGDLRYESAPAGAAELTGSLLLSAGPDENPGAVKLALADAPIESPLVAGIVAERLGQAELWDRHRPRGRYEADLLISRSADESLQFRGTVEPRTLTVRAGESDLTFTGVHGTIDFGPGAGALRQLSLETPDWAASASASWNTQSAGGFTVQSDLGLQGTRATDELFALLPQDLTGILRGIQLKLDGPFQLRGGALNMARGEAPFTRFAGVLETESASLDAGIVVENLAGSSAISFSKEGEAAPVFEIVTAADRFQAAGLAMTHGRARIVSTDLPGEVSIPEASARIHGGRIAATARIVPTSSEASAPAAPPAKAFTASVNASGLRFASILKDLESQLPLPAGIDQADDRSRGVLEGNLALQGTIGRPESRRGRGSFQIAGGRILNVPFAMRMVELSNLQLPTNARLGYAKGHFFLDGNRITFEDLGLFSSAVQILGSGSMHWPDKSLDLRFDTKPARGIPILSGLIRGIRDELVTTSVKGTLAKPDISLRQFPGPRRMLDRAVGIGSDEPPVDSPEPTAEAQGRLMHEGIRPRATDRRPTRWAPDTQ